MTIETVTIPIVRTPRNNGATPVDLVEAMSSVAAARSTRTIINAYKTAGVTSNLIVPFVADCPVDAAILGRAMRRLWKTALNGATKGDTVLVELRPRKDADVLDIIAEPAAEVHSNRLIK